MGTGITIKCTQCGFTETYYLGVGMLYSSLRAVIDLVSPVRRQTVKKPLKPKIFVISNMRTNSSSVRNAAHRLSALIFESNMAPTRYMFRHFAADVAEACWPPPKSLLRNILVPNAAPDQLEHWRIHYYGISIL
jgi:hypothetical protein